jgi:hypothetical protein
VASSAAGTCTCGGLVAASSAEHRGWPVITADSG